MLQHLSITSLALAGMTCLADAQVTISEICPSNIDVILDEDGDSSDWIELHNGGTNAVDLTGWHLSDDDDDALKWRLPSASLAPLERLIIWASGKGRGPEQTIQFFPHVSQGSMGSYFIGSVEPPSTWRDVNFDDSSWSEGPSGYGYGDGDDATQVQANAVYIRHEFKLTGKALRHLATLSLHVDFDDGYVAHLNGVEVARQNLFGVTGTTVPSTAFATAEHEAELYRGIELENQDITSRKSLLQVGTNVLALQVHNISTTSSDLSLSAFLTSTSRSGVGVTPDPRLEFKSGVSPKPDHTNFNLSAKGETLTLRSASGQIEDSLTFPQVFANTSFGRSDSIGGASGDLHFLAPTPGTVNLSEGRPGYAAAVTASPEGAMSATSTSVTLSTEAGVEQIRYTLDSSEPTSQSLSYLTPILTLPGATVVRARAFRTGLWPGPISTNTYLVSASPQGDLPIFSLVTDPENLWNNDTGIYVLGPNAGSPPWYDGANFWNNWERPLHTEFFERDGVRELSMDLGTKIHGAYSRTHPQKSMRLIARGGYGEGSMDYPFFDDVDNDEYKVLILRNAGNDFYYGWCRDAIIHQASRDTGVDYLAYRPSIVYLNGQYWGYMGLRERNDEDYIAYRHDVDPDKLDILEFGGNPVQGSANHYNQMMDYLRSNDMSDDQEFAVVASMMDTDNYAKYAAIQIWCNNTDWPQNNIKFWRAHEPGSKWRWLLYDTDFGLGLWGGPFTTNSLGRLFDPNGGNDWARELFLGLMDNQAYREEFIRIYSDYLNTSFSAATMSQIVNEVEADMIQDMPDHLPLWNGDFNYWQTNMTTIKNFVANRVNYCRDHIRFQFGLNGTYDLGLNVSPAGAGRIELSAIETEGSFSGVYFLGVPLHLRAIPNDGYLFSSWSGSLPATEEVVTTPLGNFNATAFFTQTGGGAEIVINEIQYKPARIADSGDWIELFNKSHQAATLDGWELRDENSSFAFPAGTTIQPGEYLVLCSDLAAFTAQFPTVTNVIGELGFGLSGNGERIELHATDGIHDSVEYDDSAPWPTGPDGSGTTLELIIADADNSFSAAWDESNVLGGTPGQKNTVSP